MPRAGFADWLERRYPGQVTVRSRFSNVRRIESFYGSLDDHWRRDRCAGLLAELSYSGADAVRRAPNPSRIPIVGDVRNGLLTLRNALKLYCEYLAGASPAASARRDMTGRQRSMRFTTAPPIKELVEVAPRRPLLVAATQVTASDDPHIHRESTDNVRQIFLRYANLESQLRNLGILRTSNVVGDYAEWLCARTFGWKLVNTSVKSHDAIDLEGRRYQIKARRDAGRGGALQLGIMRNLDADGFDLLAAVIFDLDYSVRLGVILPRDLVAERVVFTDHQRGHLLTLGKSLLADGRVRDVTTSLRAAAG